MAILAACASNPAAIQKRAEYRERYLAEKRMCEAAGGHMVIHDAHVYRDVPPTGTQYWCVR